MGILLSWYSISGSGARGRARGGGVPGGDGCADCSWLCTSWWKDS